MMPSLTSFIHLAVLLFGLTAGRYVYAAPIRESELGEAAAQVVEYKVEPQQGKKECFEYIPNCRECGRNDNGDKVCNLCVSNMGTSPDGKSCIVCTDPRCSACTFLPDPANPLKLENCDSCDSGTYSIPGSFKCNPCNIEHCKACKLAQSGKNLECSNCEAGWSGLDCKVKCSEGCNSCFVSNKGIVKCQYCAEGYVLAADKKSCILCPGNTTTKKVCPSCDAPPGWDPPGACGGCDMALVKPGEGLPQGCEDIPKNCRKSKRDPSGNSSTVCLICDDGYMWSSTTGGCVKGNIPQCLQYGTDGRCTACDTSSVLTLNGTCISGPGCEPSSCAICSGGTETNLCLACRSGFIREASGECVRESNS